jgi:hypothetical protein
MGLLDILAPAIKRNRLDFERKELENRAIRQGLSAKKRQSDAMTELRGLFGETPAMPTSGNITPSAGDTGRSDVLQDPAGRQQILPLLGEIAPEQFAQGLFGQMFPAEGRAEPSQVRIARVLADPNTSQEVKDSIREQMGAEQTDEILKTLQIEKLVTERDKATTDDVRKKAEGKISVITGIERIREISRINDRLENTLGETGLGFDEIRAMAAAPISVLTGVFGGDSARARQVAADVGRMDQLTTTEAISALFGGEVSAGTITDAKLGTFIKTKPGLNQLPETNRRALADMMQSKLNTAELLNVDLADMDQIKQELELMRKGESTLGRIRTPGGSTVELQE